MRVWLSLLLVVLSSSRNPAPFRRPDLTYSPHDRTPQHPHTPAPHHDSFSDWPYSRLVWAVPTIKLLAVSDSLERITYKLSAWLKPTDPSLASSVPRHHRLHRVHHVISHRVSNHRIIESSYHRVIKSSSQPYPFHPLLVAITYSRSPKSQQFKS